MAEIGSILRETRMRARIDLSQVEDDTKIRAKYLRAMENEEWTLLPGNVFARSFLRTYAEYLQIDPRPLLDELQLRTDSRAEAQRAHSRGRGGSGKRPPKRSPARHTQRQRARMSPLMSPPILIGAVLVLIVAALAAIGILSGKTNAGKHVASTPTVSTPTTPRHTPTSGSPPKHPTAPATSSLRFVATGTVYVCVENGAGKTLIANTLTAGEGTSTVRAGKLLVTLGNQNATMYVNGKQLALDATTVPVKLQIENGKAKAITTGPTCA